MARNILDKFGAVGAVIAGAAAPCCFPFLSVLGSILGLSVFMRYEEWILYIIQALVLLSLVGSLIAYRRHRKPAPLILAIASTAAIIYEINSDLDTNYIYGGMIGLLIVSAWNTFATRRCAAACNS
jgi:hypothetical protein